MEGEGPPLRLSDLKAAEYNPRVISPEALSGLKQSLERFGDVSGIVFNRRTGQLVAGHQRVRALRERFGDLQLSTEGVVLPTGEIIRVRFVDWDDDTERAANVSANNPLLQGDFTADLESMLSDLGDLPDAGDLRIDDLLKQIRVPEPVQVEEDAFDGAIVRRAHQGDIWHLGDHRLLCGDATNAEHVRRLLADDLPSLMVTDPPYGVSYDPTWREEYDQFERHSRGTVQNDDRVDWCAAYELFPGDVAYVWHAGRFAADTAAPLEKVGFEIRAQIIWRKQHFVFSRGAYHWQHEPCWYAVRRGRRANWVGDRTQSTIWDIANCNPMGGERDDDNTRHGTQKPVECMARPIANHDAPAVYDPFVGSGTTIVACEQLGRRCLAIDIDEHYVDMALARWEQLTGQTAERISD